MFDRKGVQIGYLADDHINLLESGERAGCYIGGVIYNARGAPQAFAENCQKLPLPIKPRLAPLRPRLGAIGLDVSQLPCKRIPAFLREDSLLESRHRFLDGHFA